MTRKDYIKFAAMFAEVKSYRQTDSWTLEILQEKLAQILKEDNSNFDWARFDAACDLK